MAHAKHETFFARSYFPALCCSIAPDHDGRMTIKRCPFPSQACCESLCERTDPYDSPTAPSVSNDDLISGESYQTLPSRRHHPAILPSSCASMHASRAVQLLCQHKLARKPREVEYLIMISYIAPCKFAKLRGSHLHRGSNFVTRSILREPSAALPQKSKTKQQQPSDILAYATCT